jgi:putative tryptophan/tyrosine transport system substrate-binding protein
VNAFRTAKRVALIRHSANPALDLQVEASNAAARELGLEVLVLDFSVADDIDKTFEAATEHKVDTILPLSDPMALGNATRIGALSLRYKVPLVSPFREITDVGGLLSHGPDLSMHFRRSASLVDQILKGARPGDLPIGRPSDFELGANLQTAKALNVTIPASLLSRATYVRQ